MILTNELIVNIMLVLTIAFLIAIPIYFKKKKAAQKKE